MQENKHRRSNSINWAIFMGSLFIVETSIFILLSELSLPFVANYFAKPYTVDFTALNVEYLIVNFQWTWSICMFKLMLYSPIQILPYMWLTKHLRRYTENWTWFVKYFQRNRKVRTLALLNCAFYILISVFWGIVLPDTRVFFIRPLFYFFIIATFSGPFILNKIAFYKKLITRLKGPDFDYWLRLMIDPDA